MKREKKYWLFKSEPSCFSFDDLENRPDRTEHWDGVRNFQARMPGSGLGTRRNECREWAAWVRLMPSSMARELYA